MSDEPELNDMLAYLATELLGWDQMDGQWVVRVDRMFKSVDIQWLLTGDGMLCIIEKMRPLNYEFDIFVYQEGLGFTCRCVDIDGGSSGWLDKIESMPIAVARAAYAALQEHQQ